MEVEDDVFFADLSKRISLLIMDDDDDGRIARPATNYPSLSLQSFSHPMAMPSAFGFEPATCTRESKGTGVFIPRSSYPKKKNKPGRSASYTNKSYRQHDKIQGRSHATDNL